MAAPSSFFDPFVDFGKTIVQKPGGPLLDGPTDGAPSFSGGPSEPETQLPVQGQGTIAVSSSAQDVLLFEVRTSTLGSPTLYLQIGLNECILFYGDIKNPNVKKTVIPTTVLKSQDACFLRPGFQTTYWLSIDNGNGVLSYGKYYTNRSMTLLEARLKTKDSTGVMVWKEPEKYSWLSSVKTVEVVQDNGKGTQNPAAVKIWPLPVVLDLSPFVISGQDISLIELERGDYTTPVNLPASCQQLYGNVAGPEILLDTPDFPEFSKAIQRSVSTPGLIGYQLLKSKDTEFGKPNFEGTYLRITLGYNLGDSPGIPYVLEIWPAGHYSPIHDHGDANAVIKVLHGEIQATFFDSLTSPGGPHQLGPPALLDKGKITWIGPQNYQVHQLHNVSKEVCCTIQCYRYGDEDNVHFDKFRYVENGKEEEFIPNSDMAFSDFQAAMKKEWDERK